MVQHVIAEFMGWKSLSEQWDGLLYTSFKGKIQRGANEQKAKGSGVGDPLQAPGLPALAGSRSLASSVPRVRTQEHKGRRALCFHSCPHPQSKEEK